MKIETQILEDHQAKLTVEIEDERLEEMKHKAAGKLSVRVKIPGFRPGKAPYNVVARTVGEAAIFEEALDLLVDSIYPEVLNQSGIKPYSAGQVNNISEGLPLKLEILVPLEAEVKLGDYKAIRIPYEPKPVSDDEVAEMLQSLREQNAIIEPVERPADEGDIVTIQLSAMVHDEGRDTELIKEHSIPFMAKHEQDDDWPFPGFSAMLLKKSAGAEAELDYDFPQDYQPQSLRGKKATFKYKVENVKSRTLPELNDDFAKSISEFASMDELRDNAHQALEKQAEDQYNQTYEKLLLDRVIESSDFKYSPQMLENEIHHSIQDLEDRLQQQGVDLEIYMKSRNLDQAGLHAELKPAAEIRLKRSLALFEIGKAENIQIEQEELQKQAGQTMGYLQMNLPEKEARRLNDPEVQKNVINNVMADLLSQKTLERLRDIARGTYVEEAKTESETVELRSEADGEPQKVVETVAETSQTEPLPEISDDQQKENQG